MKMKKANHTLAMVITLLLLPVKSMAANGLNQIINFNATFYGGSYEITAPSQLSFNNGAPIPDDKIINDKYSRQFSVSLTGCQGYFMAPKIAITGNTITTSDGVTLFADTASTTQGYGVRLATAGNTNFNANNNAAINNIISAKNWPLEGSDDMKKINGTLEFTGYLSCGACRQGAGLQNGELKSTVTFTFLYN